MEQTPDNSTYSAIFAMMLIILLIVVIAYHAVQKVYHDYQDRREQYAKKDIVVKGLPDANQNSIRANDVVLHDNLTDSEADRIIKELLEHGETNLGTIENLETKILE